MISDEPYIVKLHPNIWVYKGFFKNVDQSLNYFINNNNWHQWYTFGDQSYCNFIRSTRFDSFPTENEWDSLVKILKESDTIWANDRVVSEYDLEIIDIFYETTKNYINNHNIKVSNWKLTSPLICKYYSDAGSGENFAMAYHTDYQQEKRDEPGDKFVLTCNMYLNDNYSGGEIKFKIFQEDGIDPIRITYKPQAGDVLIFPSTPPYYHGVNKTYNGEKYFVRSFWHEEFSGTQEWLQNELKYGKEKWAEMEKERQDKEANSGMHTRNDKDDR